MSRPLDDLDASERELMTNAASAVGALRRSRSECPSAQILRASALGALPEEMQAAVDEHCAHCPSCERLHSDLANTRPESEMTDVEHRRVWDTIGRELRGERAQRRWSAWPAAWLSWSAYAAAVLLVAAIAVSGWLWVSRHESAAPMTSLVVPPPAGRPAPPSSKPTAVSAEQFATVLEKPPVKMTLATMAWRGSEKGNGGLLEEIAPALDDFRSDRYADAAVRLETLAAKYPRSVEIPFYLGVSRLFLSRPSEAAIALHAALSLADDSFRDDARWYLALALERSGAASTARSEYAALCATPSAYKARACDAVAAMARVVAPPR